jgi:hypothetical protein
VRFRVVEVEWYELQREIDGEGWSEAAVEGCGGRGRQRAVSHECGGNFL